jgi:hypothetical protein
MSKRSREDDNNLAVSPPKRVQFSSVHEPSKESSMLTELIISRRYDPVRKRIMELLDTKAVVALYQTSTTVRAFVYAHEWDINAKLRRFVDKPTALRSTLGRYQALISGSFALQFFERVVWSDSDLDIFAPLEDGYKEIIEYLVKEEGYDDEMPDLEFEAYIGINPLTVRLP